MGDGEIGGNAPRQLQHQVARATDAQEGREVVDFAVCVDQFVMQFGDDLVNAHAVALADFFQHAPVERFQPDAGGHAVQP